MDILLAAGNAWLPVYDDVPRLPPDRSDILARRSTGGRRRTGAVDTNADESINSVLRKFTRNRKIYLNENSALSRPR